MAVNIDPVQVKALLAPYADDVDVQVFIDQAMLLVDEDLAGKGLSDNRLSIIGLNLAAHFATLAVERGGISYTKVGESSESYAVPAGSNFRSTRFGQQAMAMDSSGTLTSSSQLKAEFRVISPKNYCTSVD